MGNKRLISSMSCSRPTKVVNGAGRLERGSGGGAEGMLLLASGVSCSMLGSREKVFTRDREALESLAPWRSCSNSARVCSDGSMASCARIDSAHRW